MERQTAVSSLIEKDLSMIWHPFTQINATRPVVPIVKAQGAYLYSEDGRKILDGISSWWVNLHGHAHPYIVQKIQEQVEQLEHVVFAGFTHIPAIQLAERLLPILPGRPTKIFFTDNGSTAVEAALKIAIQYWHNQNPNTKRKKVICFKQSYHGDTFGAMSASGKTLFNRPFWDHLFAIDSIAVPYYGQEDVSLSQLKTVLKREDAACFIFEPLIQGTGGMHIYPPHGLTAILKMCKDHGVITIADEVMTGFGRTGPFFACDILREEPDIVCLSKGLTGGFLPLGVTACKEFIYSAFSKTSAHAFLHGHSYTANPLACTSALASLDLLKLPNCTANRQTIEECHKEFCLKNKDRPKLRRCEYLGTILALEFKTENESYFDPLRDKLYDFFLGHDILLRPLGNVLYVLPPYCITKAELDAIYQHILDFLEQPI